MAKCAGITQAGTACKGAPIGDSQWCFVHHPDTAEERRRHGSNGGKRRGRGRPSTELARLQAVFEQIAKDVLAGRADRGEAAVAIQAYNGARACVRDGMAAREQEEILARLEELEAERDRRRDGGRWGA